MKIWRFFISFYLLFNIVGCAALDGILNPKPPIPVPSGDREACARLEGTKAQYCLDQFVPIAKCTLWYWHGLEEDQHALRSAQYPHPELIDIAKKFSCDVAALSYGTSWMIGADIKPWLIGNPSPALQDVLDAMAALEKKYSLSTNRMAMGVSMGGFNLATIALAKPDLFSKVVLADPVMLDWQTGWASALVFSNFTLSKWFGGADPNVAIMRVSKFPMAYLTACEADELVPYEGQQDFAGKAIKKKFDLTFHTDAVGCSHGHFDEPPLLGFYAK